MEDFCEMTSVAGQRSQIYWLLSRLFLHVPDRAHLLALEKDLETIDEASALDELRKAVEAALADPEEAAVEYTRRLVVVPRDSGEALPYESFVREGTTPGETTEQVVACIAAAGFGDVAPEAPSPDHIGAELKFMALLCYEEYRSWENRRADDAMHLISRQRDFLNQHLNAWVPDYCEMLEARATHEYMKVLARLARRCILDEVAAIADNFREFAEPQDGV